MTGGKARLLAAYSKLAAKEETLILAEQMHSEGYGKNTITRGRVHFLTALESTGHACMTNYTVDGVLKLFKNAADNRTELTNFLSTVLPVDAENYLGIYTSKNQERRTRIIKIGQG